LAGSRRTVLPAAADEPPRRCSEFEIKYHEGTVIENDVTVSPQRTGRGSRLRRIGWALLVIALIVGADQLSKLAAKRYLESRGTIPVVGSVLVLRYVENEGAFLSLGSRSPLRWRSRP
jgi:hypothetical protein